MVLLYTYRRNLEAWSTITIMWDMVRQNMLIDAYNIVIHVASTAAEYNMYAIHHEHVAI